PIGHRESRCHLPSVLAIQGEVTSQERVSLKGSYTDELSGAGTSVSCAGRWRYGARHTRELHKLRVNLWTAERRKPAVVRAQLYLMASVYDREIIDEIDLTLYFRTLQALRVASDAVHEQLEVAGRR